MNFLHQLSAWIRTYFIQRARHAGLLVSDKRGLVFMAPHPESSDSGDGSFQRIRAIDACFLHLPRWYIRVTLRGSRQIVSYENNSISVILPFWHIPLLLAVIGLLIHNRIIYLHSIYGCLRGIDTLLLYVPGVFRILDMHGVVPEELRYLNAPRLLRICAAFAEKTGVMRAHYIITVTQQMLVHVKQKYSIKPLSIVLPIFGSSDVAENSKPSVDTTSFFGSSIEEKPCIIYAGGTQAWQQLPRMFDAIMMQSTLARYLVLTHTPPELPPGFSELMANNSHICMTGLPPSQVLEVYPHFQYGFILRETNVVNRVACPTKMIEYLEHDLIPIMLSPELGDFADMGLRYLPLDIFEQGILFPPDAYKQALAQNRLLLKKLKDKQKQGLSRLKHLVRKHLA